MKKLLQIQASYGFVFFWALFFAATASAQQADRQPWYAPVPRELSTPVADYRYLMPVVIIVYLPTRDGVNLDEAVSGVSGKLQNMATKIDEMDHQIKFALEEGSRYHGYKDAAAKPSLGYKVVSMIAVQENIPRSTFEVPWNKGIFRPDYKQILTRFGARDLVEKQGVKEFWIWGYHHKDIEPVESNMASRLSGDISNSERADDLPIYDKSYVLYNFNYQRSACEAIHNHGHHTEAVLSYINQRQDKNSDLWSKKFMGQDEKGKWITGRCGWTHMPPNTTKDYDYANPTFVESDIENWTPERSGPLKMVGAKTWGSLNYRWPSNRAPASKTEAQWYIYWRQNLPGRLNSVRSGAEYLTNWWQFIGDWDNAIAQKAGLHGATPASDEP